MSAVLELARLQLLENLRRQVHLVTLGMAFVMLMLPAYVNAFSMGLEGFGRVAKDFGLTLINYYAVGLAVMLGSTVVARDLERRTLYPLLSRPISRLTYLAGQFVGVAALLGGSVLLLGACLLVSIGSLAQQLDLRLSLPLTGIVLESWVLAAACLCFSTFCSPPLAGVLGTFLYIIGGLSNSFIRFFIREDRGSHVTAAIAQGLKGMFPNFEVFRLKHPIVHELAIPDGYVLAMVGYGLAWIVFWLLVAEAIFTRRDL